MEALSAVVSRYLTHEDDEVHWRRRGARLRRASQLCYNVGSNAAIIPSLPPLPQNKMYGASPQCYLIQPHLKLAWALCADDDGATLVQSFSQRILGRDTPPGVLCEVVLEISPLTHHRCACLYCVLCGGF